MPATRKPTPSYLKHKKSGRARAVWTDTAGVRHDRLLPGVFGSKESKEAFGRLVLEAEAGSSIPQSREGISLNELMEAHLAYAMRHYRRADGTQTHEVAEYKIAYRVVRELYGDTPTVEFGPLALKAVRQSMIVRGWCRTLVNQRIGRVRRIFKWAAAEELVPFEVYQRLTAVTGLQRGRTEARESEPVGPIDDSVVDATLPYLNRFVRGMVEFQRLTGCRPGEACLIRRVDIDTGGAVWLYKPVHHKLAYRNRSRTIAIGPKAQLILKEFFTPNLDDYLFSPRRAVEELHSTRAANRVTPRYPSHMKRNAARRSGGKRKPAERYTVTSYGYAIRRACKKAAVPSWHPNQLRHAFATRVRKVHGLEAAQVLLGHSRADVTQVYAERNEALATEVAAKIG